jgi:general secretion pathway protein B
MSYILEALKRSQEERELGNIPTLATTPAANAPANPGRNGPWVLTALLLAALAVAVALYALFGQTRVQTAAPTGTPTTESASRETQPPTTTTQAPQGVTVEAKQPAAPEMRSTKTTTPAKPPSPVTRRPSPAPTIAEPALEPFESVIQPLAEEEGNAGIPPDLKDDVEAFRQRIEAERKTAQPAAAQTQPQATEVSAAPTDTPARDDAVPPRLRALAPTLRDRIPPHRISVHVYSADPGQRFVILNSRRMKEGDRSDQGLLLEQVRPDGVILSYEGERFFSER